MRDAVLGHISALNLGTDAKRLLTKADRAKVASELRAWADALEKED